MTSRWPMWPTAQRRVLSLAIKVSSKSDDSPLCTSSLAPIYAGTNLSSADSIVNDLNFQLTDPVPELQWLGPDVQVATGFQVRRRGQEGRRGPG